MKSQDVESSGQETRAEREHVEFKVGTAISRERLIQVSCAAHTACRSGNLLLGDFKNEVRAIEYEMETVEDIQPSNTKDSSRLASTLMGLFGWPRRPI